MKKKKVKKSNTSARNKKTRVTKKERQEENSIIKIVGVIISLSLTIFIALSNFSLCGQIGEIVRKCILSVFGTFGYFFPLVIAISILFNLFYDRRKANIKVYALIVFYVVFICAIECLLHDFSNDTDLMETISSSAIRAQKTFGFTAEQFGGGFVGTGMSYITVKAIGKVGSLILYVTISIISFLLMFGVGIVKVLFTILKSIVMFIPNIIMGIKKKREENKRIEIDNENILKNTIEKNKQVNMQAVFSTEKSGGLTLEPLSESSDKNGLEKKHFDTSHINITTKDIQSRFYDADKVTGNQQELLKNLQTKSINEIMYEHKEVKPDDFFYTDGMKPIKNLDTFTVPEPRQEVVEEVNEEEKFDEKDIGTFASGLNELRDDNNEISANTASTEEIIEPKKDIVSTNPAIKKNEDMVTRMARRKIKKYKFPPYTFLSKSDKKVSVDNDALNEKANILIETLKQFSVGATLQNITVGPSVTRFEIKPELGVKVSKILSLENDLKLALAATEMRIEAPIPGKPAVGIEIPNAESSGVLLGDIVSSPEFRNASSKLTVAIGKDISGKVVITDLRKMPHLLIAGATGSGKSVCINALITSLIYKSSPEDVRLIMVDPKVVELQIYNGIPHLLIPVVTDPKKASNVLNWAVNEMTRRYNLIQEKRVRDIEGYNEVIADEVDKITINNDNDAELGTPVKLPYIVIIIDEFADLMLQASKEVENSIMRIAQLARACGIYLVIATQRPSVNVISGSIKTNVPSRISFAVSSGIDSQTILDRRGAEKLLGHGDMLYFPQGIPEPVRVQGCFISEPEILKIVEYVKDSGVLYDESVEASVEKGMSSSDNGSYDPDKKDSLFVEAGKLVITQESASIGLLQRRFCIGFNRAARIIDQLEMESVVTRQDGKKPREVLMDLNTFTEKFG